MWGAGVAQGGRGSSELPGGQKTLSPLFPLLSPSFAALDERPVFLSLLPGHRGKVPRPSLRVPPRPFPLCLYLASCLTTGQSDVLMPDSKGMV